MSRFLFIQMRRRLEGTPLREVNIKFQMVRCRKHPHVLLHTYEDGSVQGCVECLCGQKKGRE